MIDKTLPASERRILEHHENASTERLQIIAALANQTSAFTAQTEVLNKLFTISKVLSERIPPRRESLILRPFFRRIFFQ